MMFLYGNIRKFRAAGIPALIIFLLLKMGSCLPEGEYKIPVNYEPRQMGDGWAISDASSEGFDPGLLQEVYEMMFEEGRFLSSRSLLIVKNGRLVSESYFRDENDISRKGNIKGITKCVASVLAGFARDQGLIDAETRLYAYMPGYFDGDRDKREITVEHVLTMRTGLEWDDKVNTRDLFNINQFPNSVRIVLTRPLVSAPGMEFLCNDGTPQLIMGLLRNVFNMDQTDSLISRLFSPLGITDFVWEQHSDGLHYGGTGLHLKPRDLALFGQFCLERGQWDGQQIVSRDWMEMASRPALDSQKTGLPLKYGYYWWIDADNNAYFGMGAGGQYLYIVPSREMVIVHTAGPAGGNGFEELSTEEFLDLAVRIIGALK